VVVLILMIAGMAGLYGLKRRKVARLSPEERAEVDRKMTPFARTFKAFLSLFVVLGLVAAVGAALDGVWPASIALLVVSAAVGYGMVYRSRWWLGQ